jgi:hypothetical protein
MGSLIFSIESNSRISVRSRNSWAVKGRFNNAIRTRESLPWIYDREDQPVLDIYAVCFFLLLPSFSPHFYYPQENDMPSTLNVTSAPVLATTSTAFQSVANVPNGPVSTPDPDVSDSFTSYQTQLIALLNIPPALITRPKVVDVRLAYSKYKAFNQAQTEMYRMVADGTWSIKVPATDELVEVFVSKSVWHQNYTKVFPSAKTFPKVLAWLEQPYNKLDSDDDGDSSAFNVQIFGVNKTLYKFKDLKDVVKKLEKRREKRKRKDEDEGSNDEVVVEKSHKKSKKASTSQS